MKQERKYRAFLDNKMLYQKQSGIYGTKKFFNELYKDCEIMQYIGLKDRNGKEIYEGDIYICNQPLVKSGKQIYKEHIRIVENTISEHYKVLCLSESDRGIEIIGNVFENPKLLNKKINYGTSN